MSGCRASCAALSVMAIALGCTCHKHGRIVTCLARVATAVILATITALVAFAGVAVVDAICDP